LEEHLIPIDETMFQDKYVKSNQIYNLNEVAKPVGYFQVKNEMDQNQRKYIEIQRNNGYLLYAITMIMLISYHNFNLLDQENQRNHNQTKKESIQFQATAPTKEPSELIPIGETTGGHNLTLNPKLRTLF